MVHPSSLPSSKNERPLDNPGTPVIGCLFLDRDGNVRSASPDLIPLIPRLVESESQLPLTTLFDLPAGWPQFPIENATLLNGIVQPKQGSSELSPSRFRLTLQRLPHPQLESCWVVFVQGVTEGNSENGEFGLRGSTLGYAIDHRTNQVHWFGDAAQFFRVSEDEVPQTVHDWTMLIDAQDRDRVVRAQQQKSTSGAPLQVEYRVSFCNSPSIDLRDQSRIERRGDGSTWSRGYIDDVTETRQWERRWKLFCEDSPSSILVIENDGRIIYANPRSIHLFSYSAPQIYDLKLQQLLPDAIEIHDFLSGPLSDKAPIHTPFQSEASWFALRRDGHTFPVDIKLTPVLERERQLWLCTIVNCADLLDDERALAASEKRLHAILDNTTAVIYVKSLDGAYQFVNRQFENLFKVRREEIVGLTDHDLFPRDLADTFRVNDVRVAQSGETLEIDEVAPHDDGPHHYLSLKFPLRDAQQNIYAVAGISTDISARVRAEEDLESVKQRLALILDSVGDGIAGVDENGRIVFANRALTQQVQRPESELLGQSAPGVFGEALGDDFDKVHSATCRSGQIARSEDQSFPGEIWVRPLGQGCLRQGTVLTVRDLTDRHRREAVERELASARAIQQALYPRQAPKIPGYDITGCVYPAEQLAGDYLDFIETDSNDLAFAVGDVSGHGFGPSLAMVETRAYLRGLVRSNVSCHQALEQLNQELVTDLLSEVFVTLFTGRLSPETRTLTYASAGHEGFYFPANGEPHILGSTGMLLGVLDDATYRQSTVLPLNSGDLIVVVTDGAYEVTRGDHIMGSDRFIDCVESHRHQSAADLSDTIYQQACDFAGRKPDDDITILIMKVN